MINPMNHPLPSPADAQDKQPAYQRLWFPLPCAALVSERPHRHTAPENNLHLPPPRQRLDPCRRQQFAWQARALEPWLQSGVSDMAARSMTAHLLQTETNKAWQMPWSYHFPSVQFHTRPKI